MSPFLLKGSLGEWVTLSAYRTQSNSIDGSLERHLGAVLDAGLVGGGVDDDRTGGGRPLDDELEELGQVEGHAKGHCRNHVEGHAPPRP